MGQREEYYDRRAAEYDQTITDGRDAATVAAFASELAALGRVLVRLPPWPVTRRSASPSIATATLYPDSYAALRDRLGALHSSAQERDAEVIELPSALVRPQRGRNME